VSEEEKKDNEHAERVVSRHRKLFDYAIGAAVPGVLSLSIALINRIDNLESYRDLDDYRMGEFVKWRDHGEYRRHIDTTGKLSERLANLSRQFELCQQRVQTLERGWTTVPQFPFPDKGSK
jgi:hypothetical protein